MLYFYIIIILYFIIRAIETFNLCYVEVEVEVDDLQISTLKILSSKIKKGCGLKLPILYHIAAAIVATLLSQIY